MEKRRAAGLCIAMAISAMLVVGCQPTPEKEIVVNKGDGKLEEKIEATPAPETRYEAPEIWQEEWKGISEETSVSVDAAIEIPDVAAFPVVEIAPHEISQEEADRLMDGLIGDARIMAGQQEYTKSEIQDIILEIQKSIADPDSDFNQVLKKGTPEYEATLQEKEQEIAAWQEALQTAPEEHTQESVSREFKRLEEGYEMPCWSIEGYPQIDQPFGAYLQIIKTDAPCYQESAVFFKRQPLTTFSANTENLNGMQMTLEQAQKQAQALLEQLGFENMQLSLACSAYQDALMQETITDAPQCYVFYFTRNVQGVPITYQESRLDSDALAEQYAPYWGQESVRVAVDDSGLVEFYWAAPMETKEVRNANVELLPFGEIQRIFQENIARNVDFINENTEVIHRNFHINRIVLGLTKVREKDAQNGFTLIPTWSFFGYEVDRYGKADEGGYVLDENNEHKEESVGRSFLTINAIDGSIIDPKLGY